MSALIINRPKPMFGRRSNGILMTPAEFDRSDFEKGWRYELINGVLIVSPIPSSQERDPNEELGHLLRNYRDDHPKGAALNATLHEQTVEATDNRRRADRVIWAGLRKKPKMNDVPTIVIEFVSGRKRDRVRDYETKRDEYEAIGVSEYWVIDRFRRTMTVFVFTGKKRTKVVKEQQTYKTGLLPGFELPMAQLFARADFWQDEQDEDEELDS